MSDPDVPFPLKLACKDCPFPMAAQWHRHLAERGPAALFPLWQLFFPFIAPSGNAQNGWFSPQITLNAAGDAGLEATLVNEVLSYGRQLGILTEALLAVAKGIDADSLGEEDRAALDRLKEVQTVIAGVKKLRQGG